ncbi:TonB-dependent receptor [Ilyomonas limi]|nr:TonB-dependent receptor [Ilyomonas limi]
MKWLFVLIFCSLPLIFFAQSNKPKGFLSGKVTDKISGQVLPGATVYIHELNTGAITNDSGYFKTPQVNAGTYTVEISYQGYAADVEQVKVAADNTMKEFKLSPTYVEQQAVTVTGVSSATSTKRASQPITIVRHDDLVKTTSSNLIDALSKTVPGVSSITTGPAISKPVIRGLSYNRVVVVNDGIRQEGQQWGDEHGIEIDDYSAQRVEVLKGAASLMYGSDAIAGVINIQTQLPAPEGTIRGNIISEYQTNNNLRGLGGNIGGTKNGFHWNGYGSFKGAQDYRNPYDGRVFNSKFYNANFGGMVGITKSWGHSYLLVSNFNQHVGMVEGERDSATGAFIKADASGSSSTATEEDFKKIAPEVPYQHVQHFKVISDNTFNLGSSRLDAVFGFQRNQRREFGNAENTAIPDAYFDLKTVNYSLDFHFPYKGNFKTSAGISGMYQNNQNKAEEVLIPNYDLLDIGGFIYTQYTQGKLSFNAGARFDNRHLQSKAMTVDNVQKFTAFSKNFSNLSASAGISYQASDKITLKANIAKGFRAPNMAELASNGAHEGTLRYEVGSPSLKSENSYEVDGGMEINTEHVSFSASLFYNYIHHFIFYRRVQNATGSDSLLYDNETNEYLQVFRFAQQTAYLYGGELHVDIHPHPLDWLHFENTFTYVRAQFTQAIDGSINVPFIPAARYLSELRGNFLSKGKSLKNVYVMVDADYTFKQSHPFTGYNTETSTGDYLLFNAGIGADIARNGKTLFTIALAGNNLGNLAYQNHLNRLKYLDINNVTGRQGVYEMGRNFSIKVNVPLNFKM